MDLIGRTFLFRHFLSQSGEPFHSLISLAIESQTSSELAYEMGNGAIVCHQIYTKILLHAAEIDRGSRPRQNPPTKPGPRVGLGLSQQTRERCWNYLSFLSRPPKKAGTKL
jgi:hypothetical protein